MSRHGEYPGAPPRGGPGDLSDDAWLGALRGRPDAPAGDPRVWSDPEPEPAVVPAPRRPIEADPTTIAGGVRGDGRTAAQATTARHSPPAGAFGPGEPPPPGRGGRALFIALFWLALATGLGLWWADTPAHSLATTPDVMLAAGRITGMVGGFVLLVQVLLMSRVRWLERWMGADNVLAWHRDLGAVLLLVVLAHVAFTTLGYGAGRVSYLSETWTLLTTFDDMISAFVATGILVAVALLSIRALRRRMPYEAWYYLHLTTYLILLLGYGHQFADGQELLGAGFGRWYWTALYFFVLGCLAWGRVLAPARLNLRHRLRVVHVVPENADMVSIYIGGRNLDQLRAKAGQYFRWRFLTRGGWWQAHPFSLSAAPNADWLRLTIKAVGNHTEDLRGLEPGVRVFAEGPSGAFVADRRRHPRALLIAGGSGIAPIRALLEDLPRGAIVIYRASDPGDVLFKQELDYLAAARDARVHYVLGSRELPEVRRVFSPRGMRHVVPDAQRRDVYLCGPPGLVAESMKTLRRMHVPRRQIHLDPFEF